MLRSAAKNHESVTVVVDPADYEEVAEQIKASGHTTPGAAAQAGGQGVRAHRGLRRRHRGAPGPGVWNRAGRGGARVPAPPGAAGPAAALRGKPAPESRPLRAVPRILPATARQGAFLQQHPGPDRGGEPDRGVCGRRAHAGHPQAHQPVRRGPGRQSARGLGQGLGDGPPGAVRRHHRREPPAGSGRARRPSPRSSAKSSWRPTSPPRRWACCRRRRTCACSES